MQSLNFNEGYKEFCVNGDETRVVRFNPSDIGIIERFKEVEKNIGNYQENLKDISLNMDGTVATDSDNYEKAVEELAKANKYIREQLNYALGSNVSDAVFGLQSPFTIVGGSALFEAFIECIKPVITETIKTEQKASEARINKYRKQYHK